MIGLIGIYLRLGTLGFGGPFALIALMESEFVDKRRWLSLDDFLQAFSLIKVLPGATATQLAIYTAKRRGGRLAGLLCGIAFVLPAAIFVLILSIFYAKVHQVSQMSALFQGMQVGALIVIADSVLRMARPYWGSLRAGAIALICGIAIFFNPGMEPLLILGFGLAGIARIDKHLKGFGGLAIPNLMKLSTSAGATMKLSLTCLKAGFLVFGTGLAIIPVLEADIVGKHHWLTHAEFLDGLAIGQITPGPVTTTATFIGYKVAGFSGAFWATVAIFTSAFFNMLILLPAIESRLKGSPRLKDFTDWAFPAVIGGIVATSLRLTISTVDTWYLLGALVLLSLALIKLRPPAWAFIPLSGLAIFGFSKLL